MPATPDKALRLIEYLAALARINTKIVRDLDEYRKVLWVHDIPRELRHCYTRAWGPQEDEYGDDAWIEVTKFPEPPLPKVPDKCQDWVKHEELRDTQDIPELYETITVEREEQNAETGETYTVREILLLR